MKLSIFFSACLCAPISLLFVPVESKACPFVWTTEYGYNILTGQPETRTVQRLIPGCERPGSRHNSTYSPPTQAEREAAAAARAASDAAAEAAMSRIRPLGGLEEIGGSAQAEAEMYRLICLDGPPILRLSTPELCQ